MAGMQGRTGSKATAGPMVVMVAFPFKLSVPKDLDASLRHGSKGMQNLTCLQWKNRGSQELELESPSPVGHWSWNPQDLSGNAILLVHQLEGCHLIVRKGAGDIPNEAKVVMRYVVETTCATVRWTSQFEEGPVTEWVTSAAFIGTDELFDPGHPASGGAPPAMYRLEVADPFPVLPLPQLSTKAAAALEKFSISGKPQILRITLDGESIEVDRLGWISPEKLAEHMELCVKPRWFLVRGIETAALFGIITRESRDKKPKETMETRLRYVGVVRALRAAAPGGLRIAIFRDYRYTVDVADLTEVLSNMNPSMDRSDRNPEALKLFPGAGYFEAEVAAEQEERDMQIVDWALQDFQPVARPVVSQLIVEP